MLSLIQVATACTCSATQIATARGTKHVRSRMSGYTIVKPADKQTTVVFPGNLAQQCDGVIGTCARHPSQLYEAALEGFLLLIVLLYIALRGGFKSPGLITGVFSLGYGASRFFVEYFRVPDPQFFSEANPYGFAFKLGGYGVTMGQSLSLPMIVVGLFLCFRSNSSKQNMQS